MNRRKILLPAVALAVLAAGCSVKKDTRSREQHRLFRQDIERRDTLRIERSLQHGGELQLSIDETVIEKDSARRVRREIRRHYTLQRKDSLQDAVTRQDIRFARRQDTERTDLREDLRHTRKPRTGLWTACIVLVLLGGGYGLYRRYRQRR